MNWAAIVWFCLMLLFLAMEANTVAIVSAWFALGSLAALITSLLGGQLWLQILLFFVVSIVALASLRPLVKKYITPKLEKTNVDAILGSTGKVLAPIDNILAQGRVKLGGMEWTARSTNGQPIAEGVIVKVDRIEGVKVFVTPVKEAVSSLSS